MRKTGKKLVLALSLVSFSFASLAGEPAAEPKKAPTGWTKDYLVNEKAQLERTGFVNWYTLRVPMCGFLGGVLFGFRSPKDSWILHDKPFRYYTSGMDDVLEGKGKLFGIRILFWRYKELEKGGKRLPFRSFFFRVKGWSLQENHPSYILVNGKKVWDCKTHKFDNEIAFPFALEEAKDVVIDMIVDRDYTPEVKALGFRYGWLQYLGQPGQKVHMKPVEDKGDAARVAKLKTFRFGLFDPGYDCWQDAVDPNLADKILTVDKLGWKKYELPDYEIQDIGVAPSHVGNGDKYNQFTAEYIGASLLGHDAKPEVIQGLGKRFKGFGLGWDVPTTRKLLQAHPEAKAYWFMEGQPNKKKVETAKAKTGKPENVVLVAEPFPPSLAAAFACNNGADIFLLKNQELPQHNILVAMARGGGKSFGKPWAFGCFTIKTPFPSIDFREQYFLQWYFAGTSYICSETDGWSYRLPKLLDWTTPYVRALRFYGLHPKLGRPVERIGILWTKGDAWIIPYTPFGYKDTFIRYVGYDHESRKLTCKHISELDEQPGLWDNPWWLGATMKREKEGLEYKRGYDLLDVFFPKYGDALTARFARMLTGTPYGQVDFLNVDSVSSETLGDFKLLACLGHAKLNTQTAAKLKAAVEKGACLVGAASHLRGGPFGISIQRGKADIAGKVKGLDEIYDDKETEGFSASVYKVKEEGVEPVAWTADGETPLIVRAKLGKGEVYAVLTEHAAESAKLLRPLLAYLGARVSMVDFAPADDQMEYLVNRKGEGALIAVLNHGAIPVGSDRVKTDRVKPPEPLVSVVKGPWKGTMILHLDRIGLPADKDYEVLEVQGIDGEAYHQVLAGKQRFRLKKVAAKKAGNTLKAGVKIDKRAEFVIAPAGKGSLVFLGK